MLNGKNNLLWFNRNQFLRMIICIRFQFKFHNVEAIIKNKRESSGWFPTLVERSIKCEYEIARIG